MPKAKTRKDPPKREPAQASDNKPEGPGNVVGFKRGEESFDPKPPRPKGMK